MDGETGAAGVLDGWLSQPELAAELFVSVPTLRRLGIPYVRMGNRILYRREAVREWLLTQERN